MHIWNTEMLQLYKTAKLDQQFCKNELNKYFFFKLEQNKQNFNQLNNMLVKQD